MLWMFVCLLMLMYLHVWVCFISMINALEFRLYYITQRYTIPMQPAFIRCVCSSVILEFDFLSCTCQQWRNEKEINQWEALYTRQGLFSSHSTHVTCNHSLLIANVSPSMLIVLGVFNDTATPSGVLKSTTRAGANWSDEDPRASWLCPDLLMSKRIRYMQPSNCLTVSKSNWRRYGNPMLAHLVTVLNHDDILKFDVIQWFITPSFPITNNM